MFCSHLFILQCKWILCQEYVIRVKLLTFEKTEISLSFLWKVSLQGEYSIKIIFSLFYQKIFFLFGCCNKYLCQVYNLTHLVLSLWKCLFFLINETILGLKEVCSSHIVLSIHYFLVWILFLFFLNVKRFKNDCKTDNYLWLTISCNFSAIFVSMWLFLW